MVYEQHQRGRAAENEACRYLQKQGLKLLKRNYRVRQGEIDLIMCEPSCLVFVEVRSRQTINQAKESIHHHKQRRLIHAAEVFLAQNPRLEKLPARFDVVALSAHSSKLQLQWIRDAFTCL